MSSRVTEEDILPKNWGTWRNKATQEPQGSQEGWEEYMPQLSLFPLVGLHSNGLPMGQAQVEAKGPRSQDEEVLKGQILGAGSHREGAKNEY